MEKHLFGYPMIVSVLLLVLIVPIHMNIIKAEEQQTTQINFHQIPIDDRIIRDAKQFNLPDYSDFINSHLPIEINVPDTAAMFWQGAQSAWTSVSEYFVADDQPVPAILIYRKKFVLE